VEDQPAAPPPLIDPARHAIEAWTWPGLFTCYLVRYDDRYWAWTQPPEPGSPPRVTELPDEAAARDRLTAVRARLVLSLAPDKVLASAEARDVTGRVLFAAVAADGGPGPGVWLATWQTDGAGGHAMTRHPGPGAAVGALADASDAAADRIAGMTIPLASLAAQHLHRSAALARAAAAAVAEGEAIRANSEQIRSGRSIAAVAQMVEVDITSLYQILTGQERTWPVSWQEAGEEPAAAARPATAARPPAQPRPATALSEEYAAMLAALAPAFRRPEPRRRAERYIAGLLAGSTRVNDRKPADAGGDSAATVRRLLKTDTWSAGYARDQLRDYVTGRLASTEAVLVAGEAGFPKQGIRSAGVARQYDATAGRIANCQVGLFLGYAAPASRPALIDRELYLPEEWTNDRPRCRGAGIADSIGYRDHAQLTEDMIGRAVAAAVPCAWLTSDSAAMHSPRLREQAAAAGLRYVLPVLGSFAIRTPAGHVQRAEQVTALAAPGDWQLLPGGDWADSPSRPAEWLLQPTADLNYPLLARRPPGSRQAEYFTCAAPPGTPVRDLAAVTGARRALRECLATARDEAGLDNYLARQYNGWYRHITLAMFALAFIAAT
jgi:SRSO17 transposase